MFTAADRTSGQVDVELLEIPISPQKCWDCGCMVFMDSGDFGLGPHKSMASALPTEPSSQAPFNVLQVETEARSDIVNNNRPGLFSL